MVPFQILVIVCLAYVFVLFLIAFLADRAGPGRRILRSPLVYTLSLSIYCTAWTFYGAVGYAVRSGLEFLTIYLGPTLIFTGWWFFLRKLVRAARVHRVTSIADLIASRYGKSTGLGVMVTLIAVAASTPYIALQLRSVTLSFSVFASSQPQWATGGQTATAAWVAGGLALFTILFGTRNLYANEQHPGVVSAIAAEAVVKLVALIAVGVFVVWGVAGGPQDMYARIEASPLSDWRLLPGRWVGLTALSAIAVCTLPRMFQVMVVENTDERQLATAGWAFPLYLFAMSLFIVPIAVVGLDLLPPGTNPDLFVLTLPLSLGRGDIAMLAFLGGFSSATSMVIVAAIALATMVSNHILVPAWLWLRRGETGDLSRFVLNARRLSILGILGLGYGYYRFMQEAAPLAEIGLISFVGAAQMMPAMAGGLIWRAATRAGAMAGLATGALVWVYSLLLPSMGPMGMFPAEVMAEGPFGLGWLRPQALFGAEGLDPVLHVMFWSLLLNAAVFLIVSLLTFPSPEERLQGLLFVHVLDAPQGAAGTRGWARVVAGADDLLALAQRILGREAAQDFFRTQAAGQGKEGLLPDVTPDFLDRLERELSGTVGAATAHALLAQTAGRASVSVEELMAVADETAQIVEYSARLEAKSEEAARTARALREANEKLTRLSVQKDAFLSQISHELRTPMTSIRAFSEILADPADLTPEVRGQYARIIHDEAIRLTRLLDDLLDASVLENGQVALDVAVVRLDLVIDKALQVAAATRPERRFEIRRNPVREAGVVLTTDAGRLTQVFINLFANARKYCDAARPEIRIEVHAGPRRVRVDVIDNGAGIPTLDQPHIFEKFYRVSDLDRAGSAGLGLAICREVLAALGGRIIYLPGQGGAAFRITLPRRGAMPKPG